MRKDRFLTLAAFIAFGLGVTLAGGDALASSDGEKVFKKCIACHSANKGGKHKVGPNLFGIVGRKAGTADGFKKYKGLNGADWTWDEAALDAWLKDPKAFIKSKGGKTTSMTLKLKKDDQRKAVIGYLKSMK